MNYHQLILKKLQKEQTMSKEQIYKELTGLSKKNKQQILWDLLAKGEMFERRPQQFEVL